MCIKSLQFLYFKRNVVYPSSREIFWINRLKDKTFYPMHFSATLFIVKSIIFTAQITTLYEPP